MNTVTGLFKNRESAERAYQSVVARGYDTSDINLVMSDETRGRFFTAADQPDSALSDKAAETSGSEAAKKLGGPLGGTLGTIGAALAALGTAIVLPGLGIVVAGPVAAALTAAGSVGLAGGLVGALTNWGVPKDRLEPYEAGVRAGDILMAVTPRTEEDSLYFQQQWTASGGQHVH